MKDKLIKDLIKAKNRLLKAIEQMPDNDRVDKWSKKEILAHIAGWYKEGVDGIPKILRGEKPTSFRLSVNGYNKRSVAKRKDKTIPQILSEMERLHNQFIGQIQSLLEAEIINYYGTKLGKKPINVLWMINEAISHDNNHAKELEQRYPAHSHTSNPAVPLD